MPSQAAWVASTHNMLAIAARCISHMRPRKLIGAMANATSRPNPMSTRNRLGTMYNHVGLYMSRKRTWRQPASEAVAHDQLRSPTERLNHRPDRTETVTAVGVEHDNELAFGRADTAAQRCAVAALGLFHEPGASPGCTYSRTVGRSVVGH